MEQGFSLTEVLVSLLLMTTTSLALLKQQWQVSQLFNQIHTRASALSQLDNVSERLHGGFDPVPPVMPFKLHYNRTALPQHPFKSGAHLARPDSIEEQLILNLQIAWTRPLPLSRGCCLLKRQLVVDLNHE